MSSPFPGMDPYLEHPEHFPNLHNQLITYLEEALQQLLPEPYFAKSGRRVWVEYSHRYIEPDMNVLRHARPDRGNGSHGVAVADRRCTGRVLVVVPPVPHDEHREPSLEIYAGHGADKRLVTAIEVLSLSNKAPGDKGRDLYLRKQKELLESAVNLVEIDLLRGGTHTTAVPLELAKAAAGAFDYHVCVHCLDQGNQFYVYPIQLRDVLPKIEIPLLPADGEVLLDLQDVFNRCYDAGPYHREVRYGEDPIEPPLEDKELAIWARSLRN